MATVLENARAIRKILLKNINTFSDQDISEAPDMLPTLAENGELVYAGTRINWKGVAKKATVDLWDTAENNPENAPALWEDLPYKNGIRIIPETLTTTTAFAKDEQGYWGEDLYVSLIDANVWTPEVYPAGWQIIE